MKCVILRGPSGSGKSTYIKNNLSNAYVVSADFYHYDKDGNYNWKFENISAAHRHCRRNFCQALKENHNCIVVDNTNTRLREFKFYVDLAKKFKYEVEVIRLIVPLEKLYGRNVHSVPDEQVKAMFDRMENYPGEKLINAL